MKTISILLTSVFGLSLMASAQASESDLNSLKNLERERSAFVQTLLTDEMTVAERKQQKQAFMRRLIDAERMVMRDDRLEGLDHTLVKRAFENYDLTFLMHASVEKNKTAAQHWFEQMNINASTIESSRKGRR